MRDVFIFFSGMRVHSSCCAFAAKCCPSVEVDLLRCDVTGGGTELDDDRCQSATSPVSHFVLGSCHHSARKDSS